MVFTSIDFYIYLCYGIFILLIVFFPMGIWNTCYAGVMTNSSDISLHIQKDSASPVSLILIAGVWVWVVAVKCNIYSELRDHKRYYGQSQTFWIRHVALMLHFSVGMLYASEMPISDNFMKMYKATRMKTLISLLTCFCICYVGNKCMAMNWPAFMPFIIHNVSAFIWTNFIENQAWA